MIYQKHRIEIRVATVLFLRAGFLNFHHYFVDLFHLCLINRLTSARQSIYILGTNDIPIMAKTNQICKWIGQAGNYRSGWWISFHSFFFKPYSRTIKHIEYRCRRANVFCRWNRGGAVQQPEGKRLFHSMSFVHSRLSAWAPNGFHCNLDKNRFR